jgi:dipeptidyl aminopeptidase/acylaminoacyl peptidase
VGEFTIVKPLKPYLGRGSRDASAYHVIYKSGDLAITGWLYLPPEDYNGSPRSGHPVDLPAPDGGAMVVGHGGIWGIPAHYDNTLRRLASAGWTIAVPNYRGEGGSDGKIEFAMGEVDDAVACWKALTSLPGVNPSKTWLMGSSHGAMVNLLALCREDSGCNFPGAIAASGVYDLPQWLMWLEETGHFLLEEPVFKRLLDAGFEELEKRSVIYKVDKIRAPVFLLHGESDTMVPDSQARDMAEQLAASGHENHRLRIDIGVDHEYIWAPDRSQSIDAWSDILKFIESDGLVDRPADE